MKLKYIIIGIIVLVIIIGGIVFYLKDKETKEYEESIKNGEIKSLYFSYSKGYMINSNIRYEFYYDEKNNNYHVMVKPYGISEEYKQEIEVDSIIKDKLKEVLVKYDVYKWDGFSESDKDVLDGDSFSISVRLNNEASISASGYMMWPDNYHIVRDELDNIFMDIYNKEKGTE